MDGSVERVQPRVRILPPKQRGDRRGSRRFVIDGEARLPDPPEDDEGADESTSRAADDRPLGHATDDEAGARLDLTA